MDDCTRKTISEDHESAGNKFANSLVVVDFETTGMSPDQGDRAIEVGAVRLQDGKIVERFQQLMNPRVRVNSFIEGYTGITNSMLAAAPPSRQVMGEFLDFLGSSNLVAHNASFDKRFLDAEVARIDKSYRGEFACSMLVSRRICANAPDHKLATLVAYNEIEPVGDFHRALADSEMTACLWVKMLNDIEQQFCMQGLTFDLMQQLSRTPKRAADTLLLRAAGKPIRN